MSSETPPRADDGPGNFVEELVAADIQNGKNGGKVVTRFPPEPNGYLHIGHAKSICLNFGLAETFGGTCNLRFDDTNPEVEDVEYVESIQEDVRWLGFQWAGEPLYASDYFEKLYAFAERLVEEGKAYVDSRSLDEIRATRGDYHHVGQPSPFRERSPAENLELLRRMKAGEFPDGAHVLRAKGDMASTDVKMRDPIMYRIRHARHHRTGDRWCIYPMYDWAHGQSDYIEGVTHSICTLEFVNHRPLYHWFLDALGVARAEHPEQIEFARLNLTYTVLSKRRLQELVAGKHVLGWDDPRMPTLAGMRRRGYTREAIRAFCDRVGVSTRDSVVDVSLLEHALREHLNATSPRVMAVLRPLKVVLENFPEGEVIELEAPFDPEKPDGPRRKVPLTRELFIERDDFAEVPPKKWQRLAPGQEVRLRYACLVTCKDVVKDAAGNVVELRCTWDPASKGGSPADGRKVKGTLHWVSARLGVRAEVRLYDRLFSVENPLAGDKDEYLSHLNPSSLEVVEGAVVEPAIAAPDALARFQFERLGYFCADPAGRPGAPLFNRTIGLRDTWAAIAGKDAGVSDAAKPAKRPG
ncbi:MAG TPA: glutamine--tRNA ligase/YqeY domain fusion protein [Minicystis sp.]|nr:glutamine--tRNA ligase/YqeY domain fusion protein [Minicystis sp.]